MNLSLKEILAISSLGIMGIGVTFVFCSLNNCLIAPVPTFFSSWIFICAFIAVGLHVSRVKENRVGHQWFFGVLLMGIGNVGSTLQWASFEAGYNFVGTGYLYYLLPLLVFLIFGGLSFFYYQKYFGSDETNKKIKE